MQRGLIRAGDHGKPALMVDVQGGLAPVQRLRLTFSKQGPARYIGHLDLARAVERALNRAQLPVAYSQGFNRRPRLSLAAALPLGYTSRAELADVWLSEILAVDRFQERLNATLPPGIEVFTVEEVPLSAPSLQQLMAEAEYDVQFLDQPDSVALQTGIDRLLASEMILQERRRAKDQRRQSYDLRPLVLALSLQPTPEGRCLSMRLVHTSGQTGRPDDVLTVLGFDPADCRIERTAIHLVGQ